MSHVVRSTDWCDIDIDTVVGQVFFQQRWLYSWATAAGVSGWTYEQRRDFHTRCDRAIWSVWSYRAKLGVVGTSAFARRYARRTLGINLDIRWVTNNPHWRVTVTKLPAGGSQVSSMNWGSRTGELDSEDFKPVDKSNGTVTRSQVPVAHEFGHAAGNSRFTAAAHGDEYDAASPHLADVDSVMNLGTTLRSRHFDTILAEMNQMIPGTTFRVQSV